MPVPNTQASLQQALSETGLQPGMTVMVHSALGQVGYTIGGPVTVVRALLDTVGVAGTIAMPAETPQLLDPDILRDPRVEAGWHETIREHLPPFDRATTPTSMGAIPEAFRTYPGTQRSDHPLVSVCANGRNAAEITATHALAFCEGRGTPFEKLYALDAHTLLLGVGFNRCTSLHYAESLVPARRTTTHRYPVMQDGQRVWVENPDMASDEGRLFPAVGDAFIATGKVNAGQVGDADTLFFSTRALVDFAAGWFAERLGDD